jgi:glucokinase
MRELVVGIDVGGTGIRGALVGADGLVADILRRPTDREQGPEAVIDRIIDFAANLTGAAESKFRSRPTALGIVLPGAIDVERGVALRAANFGWQNVPIRALLEDRLRMAVAIGNDVHGSGLAEWQVGSGKGARDCLVMMIGTGIGGAVVAGGQLLSGFRGYGGEIGHIVVRPDGLPCPCGAKGCLETIASAPAVVNRYRSRAGGENEISAEWIVDRIATDEAAAAVWQEAIEALADALAIYTRLLDPELIVVGGGVAAARGLLFAPLGKALSRRLPHDEAPQIVPAQLGDQAGCLGAALLALQKMGISLQQTEFGRQP